MKLVITLTCVALLVALLLRPQTHNENALLTDWSDAPPWPVFIAANVLSNTLRAMADALKPPPIRMFEYAFYFQTSILAYICQSFKIPDFLATGPKTISEIAAYTGTADKMRVERIMYAMAADGMTKLDPELKAGEEPRFVNTALSATLRRDHPNSASGLVGAMVEDGYQSFGRLGELLGPDAISNSAWDLVNPDYPSPGGIWKFYDDHPEREEQFGRAMWSIEGLGGKAMALDGPFHKFSRFVDIGGSLGHFLHKLLSNHKGASGVLFDRAPVLSNARKLWFEKGGMYNDGAHERLEMITGNFFEATDIPNAKDGDVFLLRYILHDWNQKQCLQILANLRAKMIGKNATLLIGESAIPDRHTVGAPAAMYKIDLQMLNILGEPLDRTPEMWKELLNEAGFQLIEIHPTRSLVHFVEAVLKV